RGHCVIGHCGCKAIRRNSAREPSGLAACYLERRAWTLATGLPVARAADVRAPVSTFGPRALKVPCMNLGSTCRIMFLLSVCALCPPSPVRSAPLVDLPDGLVAEVVAAPPLLRHPIMATLGGPRQLFVGEAAGTNLNKQGLERELPNCVLLLTDSNGDGIYDQASVFA